MMYNINQFQFEKDLYIAGFDYKVSNSGNFKIWRRKDSNLYLVTPQDSNDINSFENYIEDNICSLIKILNVNKDYSNDEFVDIFINKKYPINSRIETKSTTVPSDYLFTLLTSTMKSYRYFREYNYEYKKMGTKNFEVGHSKKGSYKIPILVSLEEDVLSDFESQINIMSNTLFHQEREPNPVLKSIVEFSKSLDKLNNLDKHSESTKFIDIVMENKLNSHIVETFLSVNRSFQKVREDYKDLIKHSYIEFESNPILDFDVNP